MHKNTVHLVTRKTIILVLTMFFLLVSNSTLFAATGYILKEKNTSNTIYCDQLKLTEDSFKCHKDNALYIYSTNMIDTVTLNNNTLYPFDKSVRLNDDIFSKKDCKYITSHLLGPLLLEQSEEAFLFAGRLYEHGQCVTQSTDKALQYYQKAGSAGKDYYLSLEKKVFEKKKLQRLKRINESQIDPDLASNIQEDADKKRAAKEKAINDCKQLHIPPIYHNTDGIWTASYKECLRKKGY